MYKTIIITEKTYKELENIKWKNRERSMNAVVQGLLKKNKKGRKK